MTIWWK